MRKQCICWPSVGRGLTRRRSIAATASLLPASLPAQQEILTAQQRFLEVDSDLLREVLLLLGNDVTEYHTALFVDKTWNKVLERADPWMHLLRCDYPSMAAAGAFPSYGQQHPLFRRTAKDLLRFRLANASKPGREKREIRRTEAQFSDGHVVVLFRHPTHGVVAESKIPIVPVDAEASDFFGLDHELILHRDLPISEFEHCVIALQMPGGLDLLHLSSLKVEVCDDMSAFVNERSICWIITARVYEMSTRTDIPFIRDCFQNFVKFAFLFGSNYFGFLKGRTVRDVGPAVLRTALPVYEHTVRFINVLSSPSYNSSPLDHLKTLESWMVIARHGRSDSTEFARLRSRFEETYLLVEVEVRWIGLRGGRSTRKVKDMIADDSQQVMIPSVFAVVSLVDESGLMGLFTAQETRLQFVEGKCSNGDVPDRFVRMSLLDLGENRMMKLGDLGVGISDSGAICLVGDSCQFSSFTNGFQIVPQIEAPATLSREKAGSYAGTVRLNFDMLYISEGVEKLEEEQEFTSVLDVWKILELCMTGNSVKMTL